MPIPGKPNVARTEFAFDKFQGHPEIKEVLELLYGMMLGWDEDNEIWRFLRVDSGGNLAVGVSGDSSDAGNVSAVGVNSTTTLLIGANADRKGLLLFNNSGAVIYIGFVDPVTITAGMIMYPYTALDIGPHTGALYAIASASNCNVRIMERY